MDFRAGKRMVGARRTAARRRSDSVLSGSMRKMSLGYSCGMIHGCAPPSLSLYHRHRFPAEITSHCVWLYFRFALSFRDVEEMLAMRGVALSYETVREWCLKFG